MLIDTRTKRRWIVSVLDSVAGGTEPTARAEAASRASSAPAQTPRGQKGIAIRLKTAIRPLSEAAR